jgi:serine/threonine protein kinase
MWSVGCIVAEMLIGRPLFPACDENELVECFIMMFGELPNSMLLRAKKKRTFFDRNEQLIRSKSSRIKNTAPRSFTIRNAIEGLEDELLFDFLERCLWF